MKIVRKAKLRYLSVNAAKRFRPADSSADAAMSKTDAAVETQRLRGAAGAARTALNLPSGASGASDSVSDSASDSASIPVDEVLQRMMDTMMMTKRKPTNSPWSRALVAVVGHLKCMTDTGIEAEMMMRRVNVR